MREGVASPARTGAGRNSLSPASLGAERQQHPPNTRQTLPRLGRRGGIPHSPRSRRGPGQRPRQRPSPAPAGPFSHPQPPAEPPTKPGLPGHSPPPQPTPPACQQRVPARRGPALTRGARFALLLLLALLLGTILGAEPRRASLRAVFLLRLLRQLAVEVFLRLGGRAARLPHARHVAAAAPPSHTRDEREGGSERRGRPSALWWARGTPGRLEDSAGEGWRKEGRASGAGGFCGGVTVLAKNATFFFSSSPVYFNTSCLRCIYSI